jgi:hypothetical protein
MYIEIIRQKNMSLRRCDSPDRLGMGADLGFKFRLEE